MSKFCEALGRRVLYLDCLECQDRVCEKKNEPTINNLPKKEKPKETAPEPENNQVKSTESNHPSVYFLIQAYRKEVDEEYQRHLYPSYLTDFHMNGKQLMLQSGQADALKFEDESDAKVWKKKAEEMYQDREFEVVPFDTRIFGKVTPRWIVARKSANPSCNTCCHKCGENQTSMFGKTFQAVKCNIFANRVFTNEMVAEKGCAYHNRDISQDKICLNCEHFLGLGDWGLACKADYYKLPGPTSDACEKFKRKEEDGKNA